MKRLSILAVVAAFIMASAACYASCIRFVTLPTQTLIPEEDTIHIVYPVDDIATALTPEEEEMLLGIGMAEAGVESVECIACVMRVVLNRVEAGGFPNDVYGVLHQQNQFTTVLYGTYGTECPNEKCYEALALVKSGFDNSQGALYFESFADPDNWHSRNFEFLFKLDTTRFYK